MCGIAGYFQLSSSSGQGYDNALLERQIASMRYRGPDAEGTYTHPGVGLAHTRLAIIDTNPASNQPMQDQSGRYHVVLNGEIYNFQKLRQELIATGSLFSTKSDTEVLIEGYARWGIKVVDRLRGMFAIAIYDSVKDQLVLLRDRVGKKPLYYIEHNGNLIFGSEIKTILCHPQVSRSADLEAIHNYLTFQYVPCPQTAFRGIKKLAPGHVLIATRNKVNEPQPYFHLPLPNRISSSVDEEDAARELAERLREATKLRMISDVPLGAFLSGGVDSSSVVAMMAQVSDQPVRTFTIGFEEQTYDEREYARAVASRYGTRHEEMIVRPDAMSIINDLVFHYGEPFADSSAIPTYYVSKIAREQVTVILSGDGGDESFLGYPRYLACREAENAFQPPPRFINAASNLITRLPPNLRKRGHIQKLLTRLQSYHEEKPKRYEQAIAYFSDASKQSLYGERMAHFLESSSLRLLNKYFSDAPTMALGAAWADVHTYLPDDLLVKVDVASMANSLEVRAPFLDHELMTWAATLPEHIRFSGKEPKSLLKKAMEPHLPHELMYRPKMGFGVPIDHWLRSDMKELAFDTLLSQRAKDRGMFNSQEVASLLQRHCDGENWASRIWALLMLELWFVMWIDSSRPFELEAPARIISQPRNQNLPQARNAELTA